MSRLATPAHDGAEPPDLLTWSAELDRYLIRQPFRPFQPTTTDGPSASSSSLPLLYKLASSNATQQLAIALLDPSTCTAFSEGLSYRTITRRAQLQTSSSNTQREEPSVEQIATAVKDALHPNKQEKYKRTIGLEATRFSASLFIEVKDCQDEEYRFKMTFDLDPLDAVASKSFLQNHLVGPLLSLASHVANSSSLSTDIGREEKEDVNQSTLDLVGQYALRRQGVAVPHLATPGTSPQKRNQTVTAEIPSSPSSDGSDLIFFGNGPNERMAVSPSRAKVEPKDDTSVPPASSSPPMFPELQLPDAETIQTSASMLPPSSPPFAAAPTAARLIQKEEEPPAIASSPSSSNSSSEEESLLNTGPAKSRPLSDSKPDRTSARQSTNTTDKQQAAPSLPGPQHRTTTSKVQNLEAMPSQTQSQVAPRSSSQRAKEMEKRQEIERIKSRATAGAGSRTRGGKGGKSRF